MKGEGAHVRGVSGGGKSAASDWMAAGRDVTDVWRPLAPATALALGAPSGAGVFVAAAAGPRCTSAWNGGDSHWATAADWTPVSGRSQGD